MAIYAALGVPEVWRYDGETLRSYLLQPDGTYQQAECSPTFPTIPLEEFARFVPPDPAKDSLSELRAFSEWVRGHLPRKRRGRNPDPRRRKGRSS
jgi:Uma2 family endonuclease